MAWHRLQFLRRGRVPWGNPKVCLSRPGTIHIFCDEDHGREGITRFAYHGLAPSTSSGKEIRCVKESQGLLIMALHHLRHLEKRLEAWMNHKVCLSWLDTIHVFLEKGQRREGNTKFAYHGLAPSSSCGKKIRIMKGMSRILWFLHCFFS